MEVIPEEHHSKYLDTYHNAYLAAMGNLTLQVLEDDELAQLAAHTAFREWDAMRKKVWLQEFGTEYDGPSGEVRLVCEFYSPVSPLTSGMSSQEKAARLRAMESQMRAALDVVRSVRAAEGDGDWLLRTNPRI